MHLFAQADAVRLPLPDASCDLVLGSPPYIDCRLYLEDGVNLGIARKSEAWVQWMLDVSREAVRVSRGAVLWVVAGKTEDRNYQPGPEGLIWEWYKAGGFQECPCYWHRVGICGSGGDQWFRKDVEYVIAFKREPKFPWSDNTANGHPPKWAPGGAMSHRLSDGTRVNQWGKTGEKTGTTQLPGGVVRSSGNRPSHQTFSIGNCRRPNGVRDKGRVEDREVYEPPVLANPGNLIHVNTGGGQLGWNGAHANEAPYPQDLAEWFICSLCPPGGLVVDPFSGSGTTARAALALGRKAIGLDLRQSQCRIGIRGVERPHQPIPKQSRKSGAATPLFDLIAD